MQNRFLILCLLLLSSAFLTSCFQLQQVALKGNYPEKPFEVVSDKKFDQVWANIIDLFATKGLSIKLIDKSSGLIVSEKTSFISNYTIEKENGTLENKNAYVVIEKLAISGFKEAKPDKILGEWNIRIKENTDGKTVVNVNLTNIDASVFVVGMSSVSGSGRNYSLNGKSTGKFEELISNIVK